MDQLAWSSKGAASFQLELILKLTNPEWTPLEYPGVPEYPDIIKEVNYLTIIPSANPINPVIPVNLVPSANLVYQATQLNQSTEPIYELTTYNRARFNGDKAKNAAERDLIREKRVIYLKFRSLIFETIDDSNKAHLQSCINNLNSVPIEKLIELLRKHRQQSESALRTALNIRLQDLKNRGFPNKYEHQLTRLDEWFDLVVRGKAANHPTYTGYAIIEELLISMRNFNESIFQTHYDRMLRQERTSEPANVKALIDELRQKYYQLFNLA
ncbi:hypothetical protein K3495_g5043 [Podosphaera aphanis]|nr:hypothetical protein K3495_g5043 [Podosphaera aphanis]